MLDIERAKLTPSTEFSSPEAVVENTKLTREDKIEILLRWRHTALQLQTADEENMQSTGEESQLDQVLDALQRLSHDPGERGAGQR
jgi:hypothetical protein